MKNPIKTIVQKAYYDRKKHPVRRSLCILFFEILLALWFSMCILFNNASEHPVLITFSFITLLECGGFMCHEIDFIIGHLAHDWRHADITNDKIISLILGLEQAEQDINDGKLAWTAKFFDPNKERVEFTKVPLDDYLVDPKPAEEPTVSEGTQE